MLLDRLRIHGKLTLLVIIPLLAVAGLAVPVVLERIDTARRATATADAVQLAGRVGTLIQTIQQERLMSIGYLLGTVDREDLVRQTAAVADQVADLRSEYGARLPQRVRAALVEVQDLSDVRSRVLVRHVRHEQVMNAFGSVNTGLIDSLRLVEGIDTATPEGRQIVALDAALRTDEHVSAGAAYMVLVVATKSAVMATQHTANLVALQLSVDRFTAFATAEQQELYDLVGAAVNSRIGPDFVERVMADPSTENVADISIERLFPAVSSLSALGQFVEKKIVTDVIADINRDKRAALTTAYAVSTLVVGILVAVVLLSLVIARAVARPLTRLTVSANRVARITEAELVRIADDESESFHPVRLDPIDVSGRDEIGELARAFERVQSTAARLVERQAASRRNVAQMFGHVGRRTQNLVNRQIALIDRLEQQETDPNRLQHLYRLDHVSSRLRRNAGNLVVLSGSASDDRHTKPLPLGDVVRLALGEIEDYTRVDVEVRLDVSVAPGVIGDLVLALAELMENATSFSPPHTRVTVSATSTDRGVRIILVDHGIGMSIERMAEENARFTRRERLDLAPTEVLGLFVVGRLARRHGWGITLNPTPGGGVTVHLDLDEELLVRGRGRTEPSVAARTSIATPPSAASRFAALALPAAPALPAAVRSAAETESRDIGAMVESSLPPDPAPLAGLAPRRPGAPVPPAADTSASKPKDSGSSGPVPLFDAEVLARATRSLQTGQPWNAFATPTSSDDADRRRPGGAAGDGSGPARARGQAAVPTAVAQADVGQVSVGQAGVAPAPSNGVPRKLVRRVPGASLAVPQPGAPVVASGPGDPDAVRDLINEFESGVSRALSEVNSRPRPQERPS